MSDVRYEIRAGKNAPSELISIVSTNFGGNAENFVTEGTFTHCKKTHQKLCEHDMKPTDNWLIDRCSKCGVEHA